MEMNGAQLAEALGVSRARVSQYTSQGKLDGCFTGTGRGRRYDLEKVKAALRGQLDPGQMMGNGALTKRALGSTGAPRPDGPLRANDQDQYELARAQSAIEDARRKRRDNERDEGAWVLASAAERQAARMVAREVALFEATLRDAARAVADTMGVDFRETRAVLREQWRNHRAARAKILEAEAADATMTDAEKEADG